MTRNIWNLLTTITFGAITSSVIMHASGFANVLAELIGGIGMRKYIVTITINEVEWGSYPIFASNPQSACFLAGLKWQREGISLYAGTKVTCYARIPEAANE